MVKQIGVRMRPFRAHGESSGKQRARGNDTSDWVCFYCHAVMARGGGRLFQDVAGTVREVHKKHAVRPGELPVTDEKETTDGT